MRKNIKPKILSNDNYKKTSKIFKLIEYLNNDPLSIINKPINKISKELLFNTSTLTRIVRKLGFKNYANFRNFVVVKVTEHNDYLLTNESKNDSYNLLSDSLTFNNLAVEKTINDINQQNFDTIINEIILAKRVLLFGLGFSFSICHQLTKYFEYSNVHCCNISGFYHALRFIDCSSENLWIIISISLSTKEVNFLLKELTLKNKNKIIVITSNDKKEILKKVTHVLKLKSANNHLEKDFFNFSYNVALTSLASLLINGVINKTNGNKLQRMEAFNIKLKKWKK